MSRSSNNESVLSFDIGIKNLSYCYLEGESQERHIIKDWGIWDLRTSFSVNPDPEQNQNLNLLQNTDINTETVQNHKIKCVCFGKNKKQCKRRALFYESISGENLYYCKGHKENHQSPFLEEDVKRVSKMKKAECLALLEEKKIPIQKEDYKTIPDLKKKLREYIQTHCLKKINKPKRCKSFPLDKLHENLYRYITQFLKNRKVTCVQIENQPVKINATMKTIQIMLYSIIQSYYYQNPELHKPKVTFLNAKHKGLVYEGPEIECKAKDPYRRRKMLSIMHSRYFLEETDQNNWREYFDKNNKKDDLADAYLMCLYFLKDN